jgi:hypothetical protein
MCTNGDTVFINAATCTKGTKEKPKEAENKPIVFDLLKK